MSNTDFPKQIRNARTMLGITQKKFGQRYGVDGTTVSMWEAGKRKAPYKVLSYVLHVNESYHVCSTCGGIGYAKDRNTSE